jgi:formate/nitrite transporter FocA (FNT family)
VICLTSGTELFTEHTATAVYPVLDRRASIARLLRLWAIVAGGNLIGAALSAGLLTLAEPVIGARDGYVEIGRHLVGPSTSSLLISAVLAGWLMALGAWLIVASQPGLSQIVSIYIVTFLIGLGGLHHSIAGAVEVFVASIASNELGLLQAARFISVALVGNLIGGSLFVAVLNYAHIRETQRSE